MSQESGRGAAFPGGELLVEIGTEEIPSNVIPSALQQLRSLAEKCFTAHLIPFDPPRVYATPRRLVLYIERLARRQETKTETVTGPPKRAAFDAEGAPTPAAIGFAKSQGVALSDLKISRTEKGEYVALEKKIEGRPTLLLLEKLLPEILGGLHFPRSMRWNQEGALFVRPIRWMAAVYDRKVVPFSYAGVRAANLTYGHRILSPGPFQVRGFASYRKETARRFVLIDPDERYGMIRTEMQASAEEKKGGVEEDEALIWQAAYTVEYPKVLVGSFDRSFLGIPKEVIVTAMKEHQGYFPFFSSDGALLPYFATVVNIPSKTMETIRKGNERVLRARLFDAKFYFEQDRKLKLIERVEGLKGVTFQEKLGTLHDKVERLRPLSDFIARQLDLPGERDAERAALLCKSDLLSGVVREFPSLQGMMGRVYAGLDGETPQTALAIEEHYLPRFSGGALPKSRAGQILAIADKLDTIVGCFGVGLIPSGSEDPYALRRQGLGIVQILIAEEAFRKFSVGAAVDEAVRLFEGQNRFPGRNVAREVVGFLRQRVGTQLETEGVRYDLREAVLARQLNRPRDIVECARALVRFSTQPLFGPLMTVFKRAIRILPPGFEGEVKPDVLKDPAEKDLYEAISRANERMAQQWDNREYERVLETLATLYEPLDRFFSQAMVMDPDIEIRNNRLGLLFWVRKLFDQFGDFSKVVEGEPPSKGGLK